MCCGDLLTGGRCGQEGVQAAGAHGSRGVVSGRNPDNTTVCCHSWLLGAGIAAKSCLL